MTQIEVLTQALKENWLTAFQMQQLLRSSSADRVMRYIRSNPPTGYKIENRQKKIKGYNTCNEYRLTML